MKMNTIKIRMIINTMNMMMRMIRSMMINTMMMDDSTTMNMISGMMNTMMNMMRMIRSMMIIRMMMVR